MRTETRYVAGRPVRFWRGGRGAPLVLLPGAMADAELRWSRLWAALAQRHEVFAPDLPGFGGSAALPDASFADYAEWLHAFHVDLDIGPSALVGHELGASLARTYSATYSQGCRSLVLINGGGLPTLLQRLAERVIPRLGMPRTDAKTVFSRRRLEAMVADPALLTDDFVTACQATGAIVPIMHRLMRGPAPKRRPFASTLVLWGEADRVTPLAVGQQVAADIPGAAFRPLRGCGHLPQIEAPEETAAALFAFLG